MGGELAQRREWNHDESLEWTPLDGDMHRGIARWLGDLNRVYRNDGASNQRSKQ